MGCCLSSLGIKKRPQSESATSDGGTYTQNVHGSGLLGSETHPAEYDQQEQENGETTSLMDLPPNLPSSDITVHPDKDEMVITSIRAADVALGPKMISGGFYTAVKHSGLEWRTKNKCLSVNDDIVVWTGVIPIPSDPSTNVSFEIYVCFEFQPILGNGECLRKLIITAKELLDHGEKDLPFTFSDDGDVVPPCSSLAIIVRRRGDESGSSVLRVLEPYSPVAESDVQQQLEGATNQGQIAFSRFRKHVEKRDLERSIEWFERALNICPLDHPGLAAAQANLAMAKCIYYCVGDIDRSLDVPLTLYRNALSARPVGHPDRPSTLVKLAAVHSARFEKGRDEIDAKLAETLLHEATDLSSPDSFERRSAISVLQLHIRRTTTLTQADNQSSPNLDSTSASAGETSWTFGAQLLHRFKRFGDLDDLQRAISVLETSVRSTSITDHSYLTGLSDLATALSYRFHRIGELSDLEEAISMFEDALDLAPGGHAHRPDLLNNLATSFRVLFLCQGDPNDIEKAIARQREAVELTPDDHPRRPSCLGGLGNSYFIRFQRFGELNDLEWSILRQREAVDLTPDDHPTKPGHLSNFGNSIFTRFERLGSLSDLGEAISRFKAALRLTPDGHPDKPSFLNNLGNTFLARFERVAELTDLDQAASSYDVAVVLTPDGHPRKPSYLTNLGNALRARFDRFGELGDLENAIARHMSAVELAPGDHPDKPAYLINLGASLTTRFQCFRDLSDLEQATSGFRSAADLTPDDHPDKPRRLGCLGDSLLACFDYLGKLSDLEEAISTHIQVVDLTPDSHPDRPYRLNNLGSTFLARFERLGNMNDLGQAISRHSGAVDLTPDSHPGKPGYLGNLGTSHLIRFERLAELSDLEQAISMHRDAVHLTPNGHYIKTGYLSKLGSSLLARFERLGQLGDLEEARLRYIEALDLTPDGHPDEPYRLNDLGNLFFRRFERLLELSDLEQAISKYGSAVELTPDNSPDKPLYLNNLGQSFHVRFEHLGEADDLGYAISRQRHAVDLTPDDHPSKPGYLSNLGNSLLTRFERSRTPDDLDQAIWRHSRAVELTPDGHLSRPGYLNNLGNSILTRFQRLGQSMSDLEQAISRYTEAVDLTPDGHPDKPARLGNLGNSFLTRFERLGVSSDLEQAILANRDAVDLTPDAHPDKPHYFICLGNALHARFGHLQDSNDIEHAILLYSCAACAPTGLTITRFRASQKWISCARALKHTSLLRAYSIAIGHLPQLAWIGLSLAHRYHELLRGADVVREAAAAALDSGAPETAVEWLEQGRSVVWDECFQLRNSYEELSVAHPDHAQRLRQLSATLEHASTTRDKTLSSLGDESRGTGYTTSESPQLQADRHRALAMERDELLREIRTFPGFERFLLHKEFSQLRASAHSGPVVMLNAAEDRCDALIILSNMEQVTHVTLPSFTLKRTEGLMNALKNLLGHARAIPCDEREGGRSQRRNVDWESVLSVLWNGVVKLVLDALYISVPGNLSRIFWCPTGPFAFLPIHAAGLYGTRSPEPGHKVSDFVVSSYVPTLSILDPSLEPDVESNASLRFVVVRQPLSDGQSPLPGVDLELEHIKTAIQNSPSAAQNMLLEPSVGTVEEVLSLMKDSDWVHFACHGIQDVDMPTISGLCLADGRRLMLSDIIALSRPRGGLAFLSACQTAMGDENLSDEAIHVAAGMLFAGYRGVIGTMWSISDRVAPHLAKDVYEQLFSKDSKPDYREAARALHNSVERLRDSGASFDEWLPFIHVGL